MASSHAPSSRPPDHRVVDEHAHELADEQRVAVGRLRDPFDESAGSSVPSSRAASSSVADASRPSSASTPRRVGPARPARAAARELRAGEPRGAAPRRRHPLGEVLEQVEQRLGPLDVVDDHHQRSCRRAARPGAGSPRTTPRSSGPARPERGGEHVDDAAAVARRPRSSVADAVRAASASGRRRRSGRIAGSVRRSARTSAAGAVAADLERRAHVVGGEGRRSSATAGSCRRPVSRSRSTSRRPSGATHRRRRPGGVRVSSPRPTNGAPARRRVSPSRRAGRSTGSGAALDRHLAEHLERDRRGSGARSPRRPARARPARLLEPGGDVERVADEVGVAVGDHHFAGVDPDPQRERLAVASLDVGGELLELLAAGPRRRPPRGRRRPRRPRGYRRSPSSRRP